MQFPDISIRRFRRQKAPRLSILVGGRHQIRERDGNTSRRTRTRIFSGNRKTPAVESFLNEGNARNISAAQCVAMFREHAFDGFDILFQTLARSGAEGSHQRLRACIDVEARRTASRKNIGDEVRPIR